MTVRRLFVAELPPAGGTLSLPEASARHLRVLRTRAEELRSHIEGTGDTSEKARLTAELAELRRQRSHLAELREQAIHRKMVMLGHEPPDILV